MHREVLRRRQHVVAANQERIALQAFNRGNAHARGQVGIFAIGLFRAAPAGVARNIQHRREHLPHATRTGLISGSGKHPFHESRIEGACQSQRLRKAGAPPLHQSMQRLARKNRRYAQPRLLAKISLHPIAQNCRIPRRELHIRSPLAGDGLSCGFSRVCSGRVNDLDPVFPAAGNLVDLLFQCHPRQQIGHAVFNGKAGILVPGRVRRRARRRRAGGFGLTGSLRLGVCRNCEQHENCQKT